MGKRVTQNESKLRVLTENHGESVRYLREYRENFRRISSEYALQTSATNQSNANNPNLMMGEISGDQMSVNQSYGGIQANASNTTSNQL